MILFVVSDAGPAKYLAYIMAMLEPRAYDCIASEVSAKVLEEFHIEYVIGDESIKASNYTLIVTGSRYEPCIDDKWVSNGLKNNIKTISIIDHWSLYQQRFEVNGRFVYPDVILVNDSQAKWEAQSDGIPEHKLCIVGNPVLENVKRGNYSIKEEIEWRRSVGVGNDRKVITFISENFRADFPKDSIRYEGFDEFEVLADLYKVIDRESTLLIKLHPGEDSTKYNFLVGNPDVVVVQQTNISKLIKFSNVLIGMGSMLLLEASLIKKNVYSYRPNEKNTFIGNINGMVRKINNIQELQEKLLILDKEYYSREKNIFDGSTENIIKLIESYI